MADYLRSALFLDFDNVYSSLRELDAQAAESFALYPLVWLSWFEAGRHAEDGRSGQEEPAGEPRATPRRVLLRRCYLNPAAFWRQRAGFVQAGFHVVDCPSLTYGGKNSADIQMALDIVEALAHETRFDEFLLLSADADFAPVLLRLRAHDRRTTILANEQVAPALRASADVVVPVERFSAGALGLERAALAPASEEQLLAFLRESILRAPRAVLLSQLGNQAMRRFGESLREQRWFGAGTLSLLIEAKLAPEVVVDGRHAYAPDRHEAPRPAVSYGLPAGGIAETGRQELDGPETPLIERVCEATGAPALPGESYDALFEAMAEALAEGARAQPDVVHATRRRLAELGIKAAERDIGFVFYGFRLAHLDLDRLAGDVDALAEAFRENIRRRCRERGIALSEAEEAQLDEWLLGGPNEDAEPAGAAAKPTEEAPPDSGVEETKP